MSKRGNGVVYSEIELISKEDALNMLSSDYLRLKHLKKARINSSKDGTCKHYLQCTHTAKIPNQEQTICHAFKVVAVNESKQVYSKCESSIHNHSDAGSFPSTQRLEKTKACIQHAIDGGIIAPKQIKHHLQSIQNLDPAKCAERGLEYVSHILSTFINQWILKIRTSRWSVCDCSDYKNADDNGLESFNRVIKDEITHHVELPLLHLFDNIIVFLCRHSSEHNDKAGIHFTRPFVTTPQPTVGQWQLTYEACTSTELFYKMKQDEATKICITINPKCNLELTSITLPTYIHQYQTLAWEHFDNYKAFKLQVYVIEMIAPGKWRCSCDFFGKHHFCYHEHQARWKYYDQENGINIPEEHRRIEVLNFHKKTKGRPCKVPSALERYPPVIPRAQAPNSP